MSRRPLKGLFCGGRFQVRRNKKIKCIGREELVSENIKI
jgi:hypothetical protein